MATKRLIHSGMPATVEHGKPRYNTMFIMGMLGHQMHQHMRMPYCCNVEDAIQASQPLLAIHTVGLCQRLWLETPLPMPTACGTHHTLTCSSLSNPSLSRGNGRTLLNIYSFLASSRFLLLSATQMLHPKLVASIMQALCAACHAAICITLVMHGLDLLTQASCSCTCFLALCNLLCMAKVIDHAQMAQRSKVKSQRSEAWGA